MDKEIIIEVKNLKQHFRINDSLTIKAVEDVSFCIRKNEIFGLVGESGCGKSTVARAMCNIYKPTGGEIFYEGIPVFGKTASSEQIKKMQAETQMIFQDSAAALNPRMTVEKIILEPLRILGKLEDKSSTHTKLVEMMHNVGLSESNLKKHPAELSGGQRQRVAIARSLMVRPKLIIADEPVASLDVSIQAQIINLFKHVQIEHGFSFMMIAHDLSVVRYISDRVGVMFRGKLVELAPTEELFSNPLHPYTQSLLSAIHVPDPIYERSKKIFYYDPKMELGTEMVEKTSGHFVLE